MKHIKYKYIGFIALLAIIISCDDFLSTKPSDFLSPNNYYKTEKELENALNGVYDILGQNSMYGNYLISQNGEEADEGFYAKKSLISGTQVCNTSISDANVLNLWQALYTGISRANFLLESVENPEKTDRREEIKGEALFLRAYYYYLLTINWGDVPLILEPVRTVAGNQVAQTPSAKIYERIVADMEDAE